MNRNKKFNRKKAPLIQSNDYHWGLPFNFTNPAPVEFKVVTLYPIKEPVNQTNLTDLPHVVAAEQAARGEKVILVSGAIARPRCPYQNIEQEEN